MSVPVITPSGPLSLRGKQTVSFTSSVPVNWSASGGEFTSTAGTATTWTAPNQTGAWAVTATAQSGGQTTTVTATVTGVLPFAPDYQTQHSADKKVLTFEAEDGSLQVRIKRGRRRESELKFTGRPMDEYMEMDAFWDWHYPDREFWYTEPLLKEHAAAIEYLARFLTKINHSPQSFDNFEYAFTIREK
ncbi:MAG: hypothetical protein U0Z53_29005 [Blastocatellia bacterium]